MLVIESHFGSNFIPAQIWHQLKNLAISTNSRSKTFLSDLCEQRCCSVEGDLVYELGRQEKVLLPAPPGEDCGEGC